MLQRGTLLKTRDSTRYDSGIVVTTDTENGEVIYRVLTHNGHVLYGTLSQVAAAYYIDYNAVVDVKNAVMAQINRLLTFIEKDESSRALQH